MQVKNYKYLSFGAIAKNDVCLLYAFRLINGGYYKGLR